jgi:23S rRNA pseudouridine1911/1915/1917 synthase
LSPQVTSNASNKNRKVKLSPDPQLDLSEEFEFEISQEDKNNFQRLDLLLCNKLENKSRNFIKQLFEKNLIEGLDPKGDSSKLSLSKLPPIGCKIIISFPPPIPAEAQAENIPLDIIFEDEDIIVLNKQAGIVTHPAPGNYQGTLVNALLHHCKDLGAIGDRIRPGIVHRLDKGTSGVMVVAKNMKALEGLVWQFSDHSIHRKYHALAWSKPKNAEGKVESLIGRSPHNRLKMTSKILSGKKAITNFKLIKEYNFFSHLELKLETGRTHQIRVHLAEILQCPILCDETYANVKNQLKNFESSPELYQILADYPYPFLHAKELGFKHPTKSSDLFFNSELPDIFQKTLNLAETI